MKAVEYARVKELFARAVQMPEDARVAFVRQQCSDDEQVQREVLSLLQHHCSDTLIDAPPPLTSPQTIVVNTPAEVDPYLVLSDVWEDNRRILRHRLSIIASVMAVLIAISLVRLFTYHYAVWGYGVRIEAVAISVGCAWVLHRKRD